MNIPELFSTDERVKLLGAILYKTGHLSVNSIAAECGLSKGLVSKFFDILSKEKIVCRTDGKYLVRDNINTKAVKLLLNLGGFDIGLFKKHSFVKSAGLYGSFAKGTNTEESDTDLWIIVEQVSEEKLARLTAELKRKYSYVKPLYLTKEKLAELKKKDAVFYHALVFGSIAICGESLETI